MFCISDTEGESDKNSGVHNLYLILTRPDDSNKEEDSMALNKGNKSLRDLMAARGRESTSKTTPKSQVTPPPPPQIPIDLGLKPNPDLKKKRLVETLEEGKMGLGRGRSNKKWPLRLGAGGPNPWKVEKSNIGLMCV